MLQAEEPIYKYIQINMYKLLLISLLDMNMELKHNLKFKNKL